MKKPIAGDIDHLLRGKDESLKDAILSEGTWGSYTKENGWSTVDNSQNSRQRVFSGKAIREWILSKFSSIFNKVLTLENLAVTTINPSLNSGESLSSETFQHPSNEIKNIEYIIRNLNGETLNTFKAAARVYTESPSYFRLIIKRSTEVENIANEINSSDSNNIIYSKSFSVTLGTNDLHCYVILENDMKISSVTGPLGASFTSLFEKSTIGNYNVYHYSVNVGINLTLTINIYES